MLGVVAVGRGSSEESNIRNRYSPYRVTTATKVRVLESEQKIALLTRNIRPSFLSAFQNLITLLITSVIWLRICDDASATSSRVVLAGDVMLDASKSHHE
jgi:hypothetical protein